MQFSLNVPDQVLAEDPKMQEFARALQLMLDRMSTSHFKYGPMSDKYPHSASALKSMDKRLKMYRESGNTENCLDAANFAVIEYLCPTAKKAHFRPQGSHESPGLEWHE